MRTRSFWSLLAVAVPALGLAAQAASTMPAQKPAKAAPPPSVRRDIVGTEKKIYSRANEEIIIRDFFQDRKGGVFLDVGCWHPINASNTYYLENRLGWSGVGIDALQEMAPRWKRNRPRSRFLNYIVTDKAGAIEPFYRVDLTDISSIEKPEAGPAGNPIASQSVMVPTITLNRALEENGLTRIDFVSIDIEGAELRALAGFDIERFRPLLVCVESKVKNREQLMAYFKQHRYHRIDTYLKYDQTNWYFTPDATD